MATSAARIEANRLNAQKSTGPRTPEGKAIASRNALKHGIFSKRVFLECEDKTEFDTFSQGMLDDLRPVGMLEAMLADQAIACAWKLQRLLAAESAAIVQQIATDQKEADDEYEDAVFRANRKEKALVQRRIVKLEDVACLETDRFTKYQQMLERSMYKALDQLQKRQKLRKQEQEEAQEADEQIEAKEGEGNLDLAVDASIVHGLTSASSVEPEARATGTFDPIHQDEPNSAAVEVGEPAMRGSSNGG